MRPNNFLVQSVQIKLAFPHAALLSIFFNRKISSVAPPELITHY